MIQRAAPSDPVLERVVEVLVEKFDPSRVIMFGSRARGDARADSDYDLLMEADAVPTEVWTAVRAALSGLTRLEVQVHVRSAGEFEERRDDPGFMEWDVWREGIVLYDRRGRRAPGLERGRPGRVSEGSVPGSVAAWIVKAEEDLVVIDRAVAGGDPVPWSTVCFHAQQAAEKYLKVLLIQRRIRPPRVHELEPLVELCREAGYELPELAAECEVLRPLAVGIRYGDSTPILATASEGHAAVEAGRRIVEVVRPLVAGAG